MIESRAMIQPNLAGINMEATITDVVEDDDLEKLSPRLMVEPEELIKEQQEVHKDLDPQTPGALNMSRTLSLNKKLADAKKESDHHFICTICFKVLYEPVECTKCQTAFCEDCIEGWKKNNRDCPVRCDSVEYRAMHRFVKNILYEHRFFCPMEGCDYHKVK